MKKQILCLLTVLIVLKLEAQLPNFTVIDTLEEGAYGAAAWGDLDNDGDMDLCYISQILPDAATLIIAYKFNITVIVNVEDTEIYSNGPHMHTKSTILCATANV